MNSCPDRLRISWSQLQAFELCAQKAKLLRQRRRSSVADVRSFFHGQVADRVMRSWLSEPDPQPGAMPDMVEPMIERCLAERAEEGEGVVRWRSGTDRSEMAGYCRELLRRLEPYLVRDVLPFNYEPEHRFRVPLRIPYLDGSPAEVELIGGIDVLVQHPARAVGYDPTWAVYDLKATDNPDYIRKTLGQGIFYDIAVLAAFGRSPIEVGFWQPMVVEQPYVSAQVSDNDRRSMLARVVSVAHGRWRGEEEPRSDAEHCSYCPVKAACRKFSPTEASVFAPVRSRRVG